jgi:hypothetical protein
MSEELELEVGGGNNGGGGGREYYVDPKAGMYGAILVDFIDHGYSRNSFNKVTRKVQPAFQLDKVIDEKMIVAAKKAKGLPPELDESDRELIGKRLFVRGKKMSFSLFPGGKNMKSSDLYGFLSDWNGAPLAKDAKVSLNDFIGKTATILITRTPNKDKPEIVYSNIAAIMPLEDDTEPLTLDDSYVRVKDRENYTPPPTLAEVEGAAPAPTAAPTSRTGAELAADESVVIPFGSDLGEAAAVA